jgi:hypothetical protein
MAFYYGSRSYCCNGHMGRVYTFHERPRCFYVVSSWRVVFATSLDTACALNTTLTMVGQPSAMFPMILENVSTM